MSKNLGRGPVATADMKRRIEALLHEQFDLGFVIDQLWQRHHEAVTGDGHSYEYAQPDPAAPDSVKGP